MRALSLLCFVLFFSSLSFSQIPNSGFENWADDGSGNYNPVGWETTNSSPYVSVDTVAGHQGVYGMRAKTLDLGVVILPGVAIMQAPYGFSQTPTHFGAWVKSTIMAGDTAYILVGLMKGDTVIAATDSCTFKIFTSYASYTYLQFPITTISNSTPDSMYIMVASGLGQNAQVGTELIVDDLVFIGGGVTSIPNERGIPDAFVLTQNYPNPFNGIANFGLSIGDWAHVELKVYDLLGREVAVLMNEQKGPGTYQIRWDSGTAPSGVYLVRMRAGGFVKTRKMILIK